MKKLWLVLGLGLLLTACGGDKKTDLALDYTSYQTLESSYEKVLASVPDTEKSQFETGLQVITMEAVIKLTNAGKLNLTMSDLQSPTKIMELMIPHLKTELAGKTIKDVIAKAADMPTIGKKVQELMMKKMQEQKEQQEQKAE